MQEATIDQGGIKDASGFAVFADGSSGAAHVMAHRMLDEGREGEGLLRLGGWLDGHTGGGSEWIHLQWHMAVFEIWAGRLNEARQRYLREIQPVVPQGLALTDAPSLLWRLSLAGDPSPQLDWDLLREVALARVHSESDPYVELHHLLAFAGARDVELLTRWLDVEVETSGSPAPRELFYLSR